MNIEHQIMQIRQQFENELLASKIKEDFSNKSPNYNSQKSNQHQQQRFHPIDVKRVRKEDWQIRRYLVDRDINGDVDQAYCRLIETLEWKQQFGVHRLTESYWPTEFYQLYKLEKYGTDRDGRLVFTECFTRQRHYTELEQCFQQLIAVSLETMDRMSGELGMCYLADFTNIPIHSLDIGLARFRVQTIVRHYPGLARRIILHNVPLLLKPILRMAILMGSMATQAIREAVVYSTSSSFSIGSLEQYIDAEVLHQDIGGKRTKRHYPNGTISFRICYARFSVKPAFVDYFYRFNRLEEGEKY